MLKLCQDFRSDNTGTHKENCLNTQNIHLTPFHKTGIHQVYENSLQKNVKVRFFFLKHVRIYIQKLTLHSKTQIIKIE